MEPTHDASEDWVNQGVKSWMVEYTVEVGGETNRHLSMISASDVSDVHHHLLSELRKMYHTSERVDVTVHRIEPVTTNTDALYFEGIYAP
ncbi:MAG: hypothetical protein CMB24_00565 [Euryarchaeota archaeon]|nr:hypothetical protein [Euryarchaeota archaeon]|tara:strand:+ start:2346 stop:2615 length:270 start_codon:yes stop_codon:yes gene_type:complete